MKVLFAICIILLATNISAQQRQSSRHSVSGGINQSLPKIWAIVIGVAEYQHPTVEDLRYAKDDAYLISNFLQRPEGGSIPDEQLVRLIDEKATRKNILAALEQLKYKVGQDDIIFFYFAGHGLEGMFLPYDYNFKENYVSHSEVVKAIEFCNAKHKIVIADACASGSLGGEVKTLDRQGRSIAQVETALTTYYNAFKASQSGVAFIMSTKPREEAIEYQGLQQGVFSYYLIEGLKGAANQDKDMLISIDEIFNYVYQKVRLYTNNRQTPTILGRFSGQMPIGVLRKP